MRKFIMPIAALALLAGCVGGSAVQNDVLAAEKSLTALERLALIYTSLPRCGGAAQICSDPSTVQRIKDLDNQAYMAVKAAEQNSAMLSAALAAIGNFQKAIPSS